MNLTIDMLKYLETAFPDKCPDISMPERSIWVYAGKVELIRLIRHKLEESQESIPEVLK